MKISITKTLALGGLCALLAGAAGAASAQEYNASGMHHRPMHARRHIQHLKAAYARDVASGHYGAAQKAHLKARAIRMHVRAHREMMQGDMMHGDMHHQDMHHQDMHHDH